MDNYYMKAFMINHLKLRAVHVFKVQKVQLEFLDDEISFL